MLYIINTYLYKLGYHSGIHKGICKVECRGIKTRTKSYKEVLGKNIYLIIISFRIIEKERCERINSMGN